VAVQQFEAFFGPDHPETGWALLAHAAVLRRLNWKQEDRTAQEMGHRIVEENRKQNHLGDTVPLETLLPVRQRLCATLRPFCLAIKIGQTSQD
jgi:hypothetical protein